MILRRTNVRNIFRTSYIADADANKCIFLSFSEAEVFGKKNVCRKIPQNSQIQTCNAAPLFSIFSTLQPY